MINNFYYRYTLHAARVFKPLEQRTVNTCFIDVGEDDALEKRLEKILVNADFFPVPPGIQVDLTVTKDGQQLWFSHRGKRILQCGIGDFLRKPSAQLKKFSSKSDGLFRFRKMIYLGLVAGFPLFVYIFLCALLQIFLGKMGWSETRTEMTSAVLVLFVGMVMVGILAYESTISPHVSQNPVSSLASPHVRERIAALKVICRKKINIVDFQTYGALLQSSHVGERYWAARALAYFRGEGGRKRLLSLLKDSHPNVVCQALYAIGKRGDKRDLQEIIHRIITSDHWYIQWYGYRAVKQLGWKQVALN